MNKYISVLSLVLSALNFSNANAEDKPSYEFKNGELLIHSKTSSKTRTPTQKGEIKSKSVQTYSIPAGSIVESKVLGEVVFDGNSPKIILIVTKDFVLKNQILIPQGTLFTGYADLESNQRVEIDLVQIELPNGEKHYIDASGRDWNEKNYIKADFIAQKGRGKKILGRTVGSVTRGILGRSTSDTVVGDTVNSAGENTTYEAEDAIEDKNRSKSYSKIEKDTKVKVLIEKSI